MLLELSQAASFFATIASLFAVAIVVFFELATRWDDRLLLALPRLVLAACISLASALLFTWPHALQPERPPAPVRHHAHAALLLVDSGDCHPLRHRLVPDVRQPKLPVQLPLSLTPTAPTASLCGIQLDAMLQPCFPT